MEEPKLKKKSTFKQIIKNQLLVTTITGVFLLIMILGSSYALFNREIFNTENDVIVQSGDLQVVISNQSEMIEMDYDTLGVSDEIGLTYTPYRFTVNNNGNNDIAYYEIRLVDKEWGQYANNKVLKGSIEVILYNEDPLRNYIVYDRNGRSYVLKTNIVSKRISNVIPNKRGYNFLGWVTTADAVEANIKEEIFIMEIQ